MSSTGWTPQQATAFLLERELFGMKFELVRIKALLKELGNPESTFKVVHVVGTNGKTSTTRFAAAALAAGGTHVGAYVSPHLTGFHERVLISSDAGVMEELSPEEFASALEETVTAARRIEEELLAGELVTQFELVTAAAFVAFERAGVEVAIVEAGLGGRWDATNVFEDPKTVVLTSVGLDHTQWLGGDVDSIASEKLAVLGAGDVLFVPPGLPESVMQIARQAAEEAQSRIAVVSSADGGVPELAALGGFQRQNFALAMAAAENVNEGLSQLQIERAAQTLVAGRMMKLGDQPLTIVDGAHNPQGGEALRDSLRELEVDGRVIGVIGMLEDKDSESFLRAVVPELDGLVATAPMNPRALKAQALANLALGSGMPPEAVTVEPDARAALIAAQSLCGKDGLVIATGSIHLVGDLLSAPGERVVSSL